MNSLRLNILVAVLILITCLAQLKTAAAQSSPPPHIIYILADDLGCNTTSNNCLTESLSTPPGIGRIVGLGFAN